MRRFILILLGIVIVLVIAVAAVVPLINWNFMAGRVADSVRDATGRELTVTGPIRLSVLPAVSLELSDVSLSNADWASEPAMMTMGAASVRLKTMPLLSGRAEVEYIILQEPTINLEVDESGRQSWAMAPAGGAGSTPDDSEVETEETSDGPPNVSLAELRLINGKVTFRDRLSGQDLFIDQANLDLTAPDLAAPVDLNGALTLNQEPVTLTLKIDNPAKAMSGESISVTLAINSSPLTIAYDGRLQGQPVPGLDGSLDLQAPSVGGMMAWLGRPLPADQPDPGPLSMTGRFNAQGTAASIESLTIAGEALALDISGGVDQVDGKTFIDLVVEGGVIDLDRYLPPPAPAPEMPPADSRTDAAPDAEENGNPLEAAFAGIPDDPLDLAPFKGLGANILITLGGLKAQGYEVGPLSIIVTAENGIGAVEISQLSLYGGNITGRIDAEAGDADLTVRAQTTIDKLAIGPLTEAATGEAKAQGIVSGALSMALQGGSPKALAESISGSVSVDLGGVEVAEAKDAGLSGLKLALDLPGVEASPKLAAEAIYNGEPVSVSVDVDPLPTVLSQDRFDLAAKVSARLVNFAYEGAIQKAPIGGLDGSLSLDVASVGALAAWVGSPLPEGQPDPGAVSLAATLAADQGAVALEQLTITGDGLDVKANGRVARDGDLTRVALNLETGVLDIDRYMPAPASAAETQETPSAANDAAARPAQPGDLLAALSDEPIDLTPLRMMEADISARIGGVKAAGFEVGPVVLTATAKDGVLEAGLRELTLYDGLIGASVRADASGDALGVSGSISVDHVAVTPLANAAGAEVPVSGTADAAVSFTARGASPRALAESAEGKLDLALAPTGGEGAVAGLTAAAVSAVLPGLEGAPAIDASATYNGEPISLTLALAPLKAVMGGETIPLELAIQSGLVSASYQGSVQQQPVPGLDGAFALDIPSVGALAAWAGSPLPPEQPDPGPLSFSATLLADGPQVALTNAKLTGKALDATAQGRFDSSAAPADFTAEIRVAALDLNAYLPPPEPEAAATGDSAGGGDGGEAGGSQGWSTDPIDMSGLTAANGDFLVALAGIHYRELTISRGQINGALRNGVLTVSVDDLGLADGTVAADATIDGSSGEADVSYQLAINGVQVEPLLVSFANNDRLSGALQVQANGATRGGSQMALVQSLNGDGAIRLFDGAIKGMNVAGALREIGSLGFDDGEERKTDFSELGGTFVITDGVIDNRDFKMLAPLVRVDGAGIVPLPPRTIDYSVTARLVASLEGQGGNDALAGLPIPVLLRGPWDSVSPEIQWEGVLQDALLDPERLANMPEDMLNAATGLGLELPVSALSDGAEGVGELLEQVIPGAGAGEGESGAASDIGGVLDALKEVVPGADDGGSDEGSSPLDALDNLFN